MNHNQDPSTQSPNQHEHPGLWGRTLVAIGGTALAISLLTSCATGKAEAEPAPAPSASAPAEYTPTATPTPEVTEAAEPLRDWNFDVASFTGDAWANKSPEEQNTAVNALLMAHLPEGLATPNAGNTGEEIIERFVAIKDLLIDMAVDKTLSQGEEAAYSIIDVLATEHSENQTGLDYYTFAVSLAVEDEALGDKGEDGIFRGNPIKGVTRYSAELSAATDYKGATYPFKMVEVSEDVLGSTKYVQYGFEWSNELNDWRLFVFIVGDAAVDFGRDIVVVDPSRADAPRM